MNCPSCNGRSVGRVGAEQYFCGDCCVEFSLSAGGPRIYQVDIDGELVADGAAAPVRPEGMGAS